MDQNLKSIFDFIQQNENLTADEKDMFSKAVKDVDKELAINAFKLDRTEKVKRTTAILLEETIEELEQKRKAVEAQNRELEIEAALEKVRSASLAMQNSGQIREIVKVVFEKLKELKFAIDGGVFVGLMSNNSDYVNFWIGDDHAEYPNSFKIPNYDAPTITDVWDAKKSGVEFISKTYSLKEKNIWFKYAFNHTDFKNALPDDFKKWILEQEYLTQSFAMQKNSMIGVHFHHAKTLTENEIDILKRFSRVFEQSYVRFLDLQKAEAQAREAQIEAALERVRSRTMGMQRSDELTDAASLVFHQIEELGIHQWGNAFQLWDDDMKAVTSWTCTHGVESLKSRIPATEDPVMINIVKAAQRGENLYVEEMGGEALENHYKFLTSLPVLKEVFEKLAEDGFTPPKFQIFHAAYFKYGYILFITHEPYPEAHDIFKRFAKVFEQTYTRFLDLQKAEAQAREAKIEAALEKVRSRTMAMQHSSELSDTARLLFQQIKSLGVPPWSCGFNIWEKGDTVFTSYMGSPDGVILEGLKIPLMEEAAFIHFHEARERGDALFIDVLEGDALEEHYRYFLSLPEIKKAFEKGAQAGEHRPTFQINHLANFSHGNLMFITYKPCPEAHDIFIRFAKVFEQTYTRFLDLQKAEAQVREAQIEASLERFRSRMLGMHKSSELEETTAVMYQQMNALGILPEGVMVYIVIIDNKTDAAHQWIVSDNSLVIPPEGELRVPLNEHPLLIKTYEAWKRKEPLLIRDISGEELEDFKNYFRSLPSFQRVKSEIDQWPNRLVWTEASFSHGTLGLIYVTQLPKPTLDILKRFSRVFDLTYIRFLDIQKAEAQTREAQIEAALERVRAKAMAMHSSKDISGATAVVFNELTRLGIEMERCGIALINETPIFEVWSTPLSLKNKEVVNVVTGHVDSRTHPMNQKVHQNWQEKTDYSYYKLVGDEVRKYYDNLEKQPDYHFPKIARYPDHQNAYCFFFNQGGIFVYTTDELNAEEKLIFQRFAKVFEQTYTRFLDLQKAEAQAREAQIEAALERVRAASMAMHKSDELQEVISVVLNQMISLGIKTDVSYIVINAENTKDFNLWLATENNDYARQINLPYFKHPIHDDALKAIKKQVGLDTHSYSKEEKNRYFEYQFKHSDLKYSPEERKKFILDAPGYTRTIGINKHTSIAVNNYATTKFSTEENEILIRIAKVFEQAYTRFLDIKKAEAQAREAQIEAALERVRAKAMSMQNSEDLNATIGAFYRELEQFSITPRRCGVGLLQKNRLAELSTMNTMEKGNSIEIIGKLKMEGHWVLDGVYDNWIFQKEFHPVLRGNEIKEYNKILKPQMDFPEYPNNTVQFGYFFFFPEGGVYAWTEKEMKEDELNIYRRFTRVLSLTYKRYKDLKDAEANALEAVRRASLDRVRAEIASMRSVDDLQRITPIIWHELTSLGVPFVRCGVFIIDEATEHIQVHLSSPDGNALGALDLPFNSSELTLNSVNHWRQGVIFKTHWNKQEFLNFMQSMIKLGQISNPETYQGATQPPESLHLHFVPFKQGMLYVGNIDPLELDALELVKSLAESFSIAFARYEDFRQLEMAKNQIEKTLTELKAAQAQLIQAEKMASLGELTAGIAHEIQNPLNFVNNFSELSNELMEEMKEELAVGNVQLANEVAGDISQNLQKINHHGKRAADIVKGMLLHSRTSNGQKEPTDINALADEYLRLSYHGLRAKDKSFNADFKTNFDPNLPKINVIPQDIGRVLLNLINNAFYACAERSRSSVGKKDKELTPQPPDGGTESSVQYKPTVTITTSYSLSFGEGRGEVKIIVKDNGNGIPPSIVDKIFQPFFTTKPTGQGTGLGLSLSYDIVKAHGGELSVRTPSEKVETKKRYGTEFTIIIPI